MLILGKGRILFQIFQEYGGECMLLEIKFDEYTTVVVDCNEKLEHDDLFCILNEYELDRINDNYFRKRKETLRLEGIVFSL